MQQEKCTAEREIENGGKREGVLSVEGATLEGRGVAQTGEGSATRIDTSGGTTCVDG